MGKLQKLIKIWPIDHFPQGTDTNFSWHLSLYSQSPVLFELHSTHSKHLRHSYMYGDQKGTREKGKFLKMSKGHTIKNHDRNCLKYGSPPSDLVLAITREVLMIIQVSDLEYKACVT